MELSDLHFHADTAISSSLFLSPLINQLYCSVHEEFVSRSVMDNHQLLLFSDEDEDKEEEEEELTAFDGSLKDSINSDVSRMERSQRELTSKRSCLRWIFLVIHLVISIPLTVTMVTLVVVQP